MRPAGFLIISAIFEKNKKDNSLQWENRALHEMVIPMLLKAHDILIIIIADKVQKFNFQSGSWDPIRERISNFTQEEAEAEALRLGNKIHSDLQEFFKKADIPSSKKIIICRWGDINISDELMRLQKMKESTAQEDIALMRSISRTAAERVEKLSLKYAIKSVDRPSVIEGSFHFLLEEVANGYTLASKTGVRLSQTTNDQTTTIGHFLPNAVYYVGMFNDAHPLLHIPVFREIFHRLNPRHQKDVLSRKIEQIGEKLIDQDKQKLREQLQELMPDIKDFTNTVDTYRSTLLSFVTQTTMADQNDTVSLVALGGYFREWNKIIKGIAASKASLDNSSKNSAHSSDSFSGSSDNSSSMGTSNNSSAYSRSTSPDSRSASPISISMESDSTGINERRNSVSMDSALLLSTSNGSAEMPSCTSTNNPKRSSASAV
jgi:hypothetical protein